MCKIKYLFSLLILLIVSIPAFALWAPGNADYINTWLVLGTFNNDINNENFEKDLINETKIAPYDGLTTNGKKWEYFDDRYFSRNYDDYQDLFSYYRYKKNEDITSKIAYAHVYVYSDANIDAQLRGAGDVNFKAFFNGVEAIKNIKTNAAKDGNIGNIKIKKGMNSILVKVANNTEGYLGFYLRICDKDGNEVPNLHYSLNNSKKLAITTKNLASAGKNNMPLGYREWPYVEFRVPYYNQLRKIDKSISFEELKLATSASSFYFLADGASDQTWSIKGKLPIGLKLEKDGKIIGRISNRNKLGNYKFIITVKDGAGNSASKEFTLTVKERPNKWIEDGRLTALMHSPERISGDQIVEIAKLMKRQNYTIGMPISYGNGDYTFRWSSRFDENPEYKDVIPAYKKALEDAGVAFGMYIGNFNDCPQFSYDQGMLMLEDAMKKLNPKAFWFDWLGVDRPMNDALFSAAKSYNPNIVLILNGVSKFYNGDWDIITIEDFSYGDLKSTWELWPQEFRWDKLHIVYDWPKTGAVETWRLIINPLTNPNSNNGNGFFQNKTLADWKDTMRLEISLIGDGAIANMDHSPDVGYNPNVMKGKDLYYSEIMGVHKKMADWANPKGLTPLFTSYTNVMPYPLTNTDWGYSLININKDKIYLHFMINRRDKKGLPKSKTITVNPILGSVKSIVCMNTGKNISFVQNKNNLTLNLKNVSQDNVDTIICVNLKNTSSYMPKETKYPMTDFSIRKPRFKRTPLTVGIPGNVASNKPSKLLSLDGVTDLTPSGEKAYAYLGNDNDYDTTAQGAWEWAWSYYVDLEKSYDVGKIKLYFNKACFATDFTITVSSDGKNWTEIEKLENNEKTELIFDNLDANFRYIKVNAIKPNGPGQKGLQMGIAELEVYKK